MRLLTRCTAVGLCFILGTFVHCRPASRPRGPVSGRGATGLDLHGLPEVLRYPNPTVESCDVDSADVKARISYRFATVDESNKVVSHYSLTLTASSAWKQTLLTPDGRPSALILKTADGKLVQLTTYDAKNDSEHVTLWVTTTAKGCHGKILYSRS